MKVSLVMMNPGPEQGKIVSIERFPFVVGRDPNCHLRPVSGKVSKRHCALSVQHDRVSISDLGSTNGTFLNDMPVHSETTVQTGDRLRIGPLMFDVMIEQPEAPPTPVPFKIEEQAVTGDWTEDDAAEVLLGDMKSGGHVSSDDTTIHRPAKPAGGPPEKSKSRPKTAEQPKSSKKR
jgi:predicted component of type VI protein secretion system